MGLSFDEYKTLIDLSPYKRPCILDEAEKSDACDTLLQFLLREKGMIAAYSTSVEKKMELIRKYSNVRSALPVPEEILEIQDRILWTANCDRSIVNPSTDISFDQYGICIWEGDITRLSTDAIVNAANKSLLGCFLPNHNCIDNVIHSRAGMQMRSDCMAIVAQQGYEEEVGDVKVTRAYNLPSKYVFHTVGPMVMQELTDEMRMQLRASYLSCLNLADKMGLSSIAFCCLSTGVFNFPREEAAEIASGTVLNWKLRHPASRLKVIFNTFISEDTFIYRKIFDLVK